MSDVIKPECECPFDPKQYQCDCFIAPVGSFSWALIQLKLRKRVARSAWGDKGMHLAITPRVSNLIVEEGSAYAVDGVAVGTQYDYLTHIDLRNEHGNFVPWQPTQEDMMACDWGFVEEGKEEPVKPEPKPESDDHTMVLDVVLGTAKADSFPNEAWGYLNETRNDLQIFGSLNVIKNNTDIVEIELFSWFENTRPVFAWNAFSHDNNEGYKKMEKLFNKDLSVTVDDVTYDLGKPSIHPKEKHVLSAWYEGTEAQKLGEILKQTGQTKRFYCNWR